METFSVSIFFVNYPILILILIWRLFKLGEACLRHLSLSLLSSIVFRLLWFNGRVASIPIPSIWEFNEHLCIYIIHQCGGPSSGFRMTFFTFVRLYSSFRFGVARREAKVQRFSLRYKCLLVFGFLGLGINIDGLLFGG